VATGVYPIVSVCDLHANIMNEGVVEEVVLLPLTADRDALRPVHVLRATYELKYHDPKQFAI
jgi:hypothetical protein